MIYEFKCKGGGTVMINADSPLEADLRMPDLEYEKGVELEFEPISAASLKRCKQEGAEFKRWEDENKKD